MMIESAIWFARTAIFQLRKQKNGERGIAPKKNCSKRFLISMKMHKSTSTVSNPRPKPHRWMPKKLGLPRHRKPRNLKHRWQKNLRLR